MSKYFLLTSVAVFSLHASTIQEREEQHFIYSFVDNYGFTPNARDTREYHPFILGQTRESLLTLERCLQESGFNLKGRVVIAGYQEDAIPSYYTSCKQAIIDDEVSTKTKAGWHFAAGNLFGFLTGFIFHDVNEVYTKNKVFEHIAAEKIGLFDHRATLFHQHAFGQAYEPIIAARKKIVKHIAQSNIKGAIGALRDVWKLLYAHELKDGSGNLIATQDILFSLHYAKYLLDSQLPVLKFFIGPDITYPIEVLACQRQEATEGAQHFLACFTAQLKPIDDEETAYIFCSFVDGVGKSTLLGNVKNWCAYAQKFEKYQRVDNSSSQSAELFKYAHKIHIVDLPAQISHFTYKPDGAVYVDMQTVTSMRAEQCTQVRDYVDSCAEQLIATFRKKLHEPRADSSCPDELYAYNVRMLGKQEVTWVPFEYQGMHGLFNTLNPEDIRVLVPFENVHSYGLKVAQPEQMLFTKGLRLPWKFDRFVDDLIHKLKTAGIKNIVFVDFASMYPRTSRENIRVNFVLQQLCNVFGPGFSPDKSLYRNVISNQELYGLLVRSRADICKGMLLETGMRYALYELVKECQSSGTDLLTVAQLRPLLQAQFWQLYDVHEKELLVTISHKIDAEIEQMKRIYEYDNDFEALVRFDFELLAKLSQFIEELFTVHIQDDYFNALWADLDGALPNTQEIEQQAAVTIEQKSSAFPIIQYANGLRLAVLYSFDGMCRDRIALKDFFCRVRAQWYATLANLIHAQDSGEQFTLQKIEVPVPPLVIKKDGSGRFYCLQKVFEVTESAGKKPPSRFFVGSTHDLDEKRRWAMINEIPHCLDWDAIKTCQDLYAFGYNPHGSHKTMVTHLIAAYKKYQEEQGCGHYFMPAVDLCYQLNYLNSWQGVAAEGARFTAVKKVSPSSKKALQLLVRTLATLEMIIKDLDSHVMIRRGNEDDFAAALQLIERITLPVYFGVQLDEPLFEDYTQVEAVLEWEDLCEY